MPCELRLRAGLTGRRIVITRAAHQAGDFAALLESRGAIPVMYPCLSIAPLEDKTQLKNAFNTWENDGYDWVVFTSVNAVEMVAQQTTPSPPAALPHGEGRNSIAAPGKDVVAPSPRLRGRGGQGVRGIAAVGAATACAVERWFGVNAACVPENHHAAALAEMLPVKGGNRVLLMQAEIAPPTLADALTNRGVLVDRVAVYRTVIGGDGGADLPALLARGEIDVITFASPSAIQGLIQRLFSPLPEGEGLGVRAVIACIGATTAQAANAAGFQVAVVPPVATIEHLIHSLEEYFATR